MSSPNVRRATPADAADIAAVHVRSWQVAYRGLVPDDVLDGLSVAQRTSTWEGLLARATEGAFTLVAESDRIVGFCSVIVPSRDADDGDRTAEIAAVYVDPDHWRSGVGGALLAVALHELAAAGCDEVTLWVFAENRGAMAFYRRFGFAADGAETRHEPSGRQEVRLHASVDAGHAAT